MFGWSGWALAMTGLPAAMAAAKSPPLMPLKAKGKLLGPKMTTGPDRGETGADIFFEVEGSVAPRLLAHCRRCLAKLVGGAGKLDVFEAWGYGKSSFFGSRCDDAVSGGFDVAGVSVEEGCDRCRVHGSQFRGGFGRGGEGGIAVGPSADRESEGKGFALGGIFCVKGSLGVGCTPLAVNQYLSYIHWLSSLSLFDGVDKSAYAIDGNLDLIVALERKGVGWNDACAGQQEAPIGKSVVAKEVLDQCRRIAFQFS